MTTSATHTSPFTTKLRTAGFIRTLPEPTDSEYDSARARLERHD
jgi:hypothetical protein